MDRNAIAQVVDVDLLENSRICKVDGHEAILGEFDEKNYLCWTISSKYSCVLEYMNDSVTETDILSIAESVR